MFSGGTARKHRDKIAEVLRDARAGGSGNDVEFRTVHRDGSMHWAAVSWQPMYDNSKQHLGFRTSVRDVTERHRLREELRLYNQHLEQLVQERTAKIAQLEEQRLKMELPPLRNRRDDMMPLADAFLKNLQRGKTRISGFSDEVIDRFRRYEWPGNIRELRNVIERTVALSRTETVQLSDLPKAIRDTNASPSRSVSALAEISREEAIDNADRSYLTALLEKHGGNVSHAAQQAGLSRQGMHKLLARHCLDPAEFRR